LKQAGGLAVARDYVDALLVELDRRAFSPEFHDESVDTIFFGGGTPSILPAEWIGEVLTRVRARFLVADTAEVTVEANPGTVDEDKFATLFAVGVNRLSLGVQSFSDTELQLLGRIHTAQHAHEALAATHTAGCANVSLDLIYGLPGQSLADWQRTLEQAVAARPEHISAYALSVEPGTPLAESIAQGLLPAPDEDLAADMYLSTREVLTGAGYEHYEISNFSRPGFACQHNRKYWAYDEYLGVGASACSFRGGIRWNNTADLRVYITEMQQGRFPVTRAEMLSSAGQAGEIMMLGLRTAEGVSYHQVKQKTSCDPRKMFADQLEELQKDGMLLVEGDNLRLPARQWVLSNEALARFIVC
jgi:oxygen-independent coproporphyrinogen-3 oxidase